MSDEQYVVRLIGPFAIVSPGGEELVISGKRGRAILALLALAPTHVRARTWLQAILWERSGRTAGQDSLRRELSRMRKDIGHHVDEILHVSRETITLKIEKCAVTRELSSADEDQDFLEGLDIVGADAFEDWLREQRQSLAVKSQRCSRSSPVHGPLGRQERLDTKYATRHDCRATPDTYREQRGATSIHVEINVEPYAQSAAVLLFLSVLKEVFSDRGIYRVFDSRDAKSETNRAARIVIRLSEIKFEHDMCIYLSCEEARFGEILCSTRYNFSYNSEELESRYVKILRTSSDFVDSIPLDRLQYLDPAQRLAVERSRYCYSIVRKLFALVEGAQSEADILLDQWTGVEGNPCGLIFAWKAYSLTFRHDNIGGVNYVANRPERAIELAKYALEYSASDPLVPSLLAHVYSFVVGDFQSCQEMLSAAKRLGATNYFYYDALAMFNFYTGNLNEALQAAMTSYFLASTNCCSYDALTSLCMIHGLLGRLSLAIEFGERSLAMQVNPNGLIFPPTMRYLGASYAASGKQQRARALFEPIQRNDPSFKSKHLHETRNALPSEAGFHFVHTGLKLVGM